MCSFISYARSNGEQFAAKLRQRLEAEHIPLWQDRVGMEGGKEICRFITRGSEPGWFRTGGGRMEVVQEGGCREEMVW